MSDKILMSELGTNQELWLDRRRCFHSARRAGATASVVRCSGARNEGHGTGKPHQRSVRRSDEGLRTVPGQEPLCSLSLTSYRFASTSHLASTSSWTCLLSFVHLARTESYTACTRRCQSLCRPKSSRAKMRTCAIAAKRR